MSCKIIIHEGQICIINFLVSDMLVLSQNWTIIRTQLYKSSKTSPGLVTDLFQCLEQARQCRDMSPRTSIFCLRFATPNPNRKNTVGFLGHIPFKFTIFLARMVWIWNKILQNQSPFQSPFSDFIKNTVASRYPAKSMNPSGSAVAICTTNFRS